MKVIAHCKGAAVAAALLALGACSSGPHVRAGAPPVAGTASEIDVALMLLNQGDEPGARKRIKALLKRDPMNASAQVLRDSIERDPKDLLGPDNFAYTVRQGDTITSLAEHFLGNRLKSYQLARYNGLKSPVKLIAGQSLRIPAQPARAEPVRRPEPTAARPSPALPAPKPPAPVAKPVAPVANPAAARQLRGAGLAALNQGNIDRAVGLLRRAAKLDPGNLLIARDLGRAERIAATVHARR
jgi:hypothetical protein